MVFEISNPFTTHKKYDEHLDFIQKLSQKDFPPYQQAAAFTGVGVSNSRTAAKFEEVE